MNNPIAADIVSCDNISIVDHHTVTEVHIDISAIKRRHRPIDKICAEDIATDNMVGKYRGERGDVIK